MARSAALDGVRLAVGTFTALRVPPPRRVDRGAAATAMLAAPLVGTGLAVVAAGVLAAGDDLLGGPGDPPLLAAALAIATVAWMTRGLHLDGLADVGDGLGCGRPAPAALEVMRRSDVGALGAALLVLVVVVQVLALAGAAGAGRGTAALVLALATGRGAAALACTRGIPAARAGGLGAAVAGSVPRVGAVAVVASLLGLSVVLGVGQPVRAAVVPVAAVLTGLGVAGLLLRRCVLRFGGVTGDVLGALVEVGATGVLVVMAAAPVGP